MTGTRGARARGARRRARCRSRCWPSWAGRAPRTRSSPSARRRWRRSPPRRMCARSSADARASGSCSRRTPTRSARGRARTASPRRSSRWCATARADGFDALATFAPSATTQRARLAERDALDLPARARALATALRDAGFSLDACAPALDAFAHPSHEIVETQAASTGDEARSRGSSRATSRATAAKRSSRPTCARRATRRATPDLRAAILAADPGSAVTGLRRDRPRAPRRARARPLPRGRASRSSSSRSRCASRCGARGTRSSRCDARVRDGVGRRGDARARRAVARLRRARPAGALRRDHRRVDVPAPRGERAAARRPRFARKGPLVAATALTTAAGFVALVACRFDGLRDLGVVGTLGVLAGLVAALVVVPATLRVMRTGD